MKKYFPLFALVLLILVGCGEAQIDTIVSTSPKGDKKLTISGSKNSPLAPIMVDVLGEVKNGKSEFQTEFAGTSLTAENCEVTWDNNRNGNIRLTLPDGEFKYLDFICTDDTIHVINRLVN